MKEQIDRLTKRFGRVYISIEGPYPPEVTDKWAVDLEVDPTRAGCDYDGYFHSAFGGHTIEAALERIINKVEEKLG